MSRGELLVVLVVCVATIALALIGGCSDMGIPGVPPEESDSDSGSVSSPPPSDESDGTSTSSDDSLRNANDSQSSPPSSAADDSQEEPAMLPEVLAGLFAGCWESPEWGWMRLEAEGPTVSGAYEHDEGRIKGIADGSVLSGEWSEEPSYAPPNDGGRFEFVLSEGGESFSGHWRYGEGDGWQGSWTAVRVECPPSEPSEADALWASKWDTNYGEMELRFSGDRVTGEYESDDGRIEGVVSGRLMTGTWSEKPSYAPPKDAGQFEFTLSEDGRSFTGRWRYGSEGEWRSWSGTVHD